jgi:pimeloyl-ACP methyl ester carboxylesterase
LQGAGFVHRGYSAGLNDRSDVLHVYVEHDGTPWIDNRIVAGDPTPRTPFALELMGRDTGPRLLLGRPCYFEPESACDPMLWTHRRYSAEVVASMAAALRSFLSQHPYRKVLLIGYSGGGTIAWLMAAQSPDAIGVITVAANLDIDAWTKIHGYSAMEGSLNPALLPQLAPAMVQVNYFGGRDQNVPPSVIRSFARQHPGAKMIEIAEFDHVCCWIERWPRLLEESTALLRPAHLAPH